MAHAHSMLDTNATNIYSEYVLPIAFTTQQLLHQSASISPCTYIACMSYFRVSCYVCLGRELLPDPHCRCLIYCDYLVKVEILFFALLLRSNKEF